MAEFRMTVNLDNADFEDPKYGLRRLFKRLVVGNALRGDDTEGNVRDVNGNTVGHWEITP